jgi:uncharacterized linocin/CFP29 family protein
VLRLDLAARRLVDVEGPFGWTHAAVPTGTVEPLEPVLGPEVRVVARRPVQLVELDSAFRLARSELERLERGARDPDLAPLIAAAARIARAEDRALFHGIEGAGMTGIVTASARDGLALDAGGPDHLAAVIEALERLRQRGVGGPFALALGPREHGAFLRARDADGNPVIERIQTLLGGPLARVPALDGAVVMSQRGGDFLLSLGQDLSLGYRDHSRDEVELYLVESFAFQVLSPDAAVPLELR